MPPPLQPFNVYEMITSTQKGVRVGGSYDNVTAVNIAAAYYQAKGAYSRTFLLGVFDESAGSTVVAFIGEGYGKL